MNVTRSDPVPPVPNLCRAHKVFDRAVDRLYRRESFTSEREHMEHLFKLYEKIQIRLGASAKKGLWRRRKISLYGKYDSNSPRMEINK